MKKYGGDRNGDKKNTGERNKLIVGSGRFFMWLRVLILVQG